MNPGVEWEEIESLFHEAVELPPHERRPCSLPPVRRPGGS